MNNLNTNHEQSAAPRVTHILFPFTTYIQEDQTVLSGSPPTTFISDKGGAARIEQEGRLTDHMK